MAVLWCPGCTKSILAVGLFEGTWEGNLSWLISTGHEHGSLSFTVYADDTFEGTGEIHFWEGQNAIPLCELRMAGSVNPGGTIEGRCYWKDVTPTGNSRTGDVKINGVFDSANGKGTGSMTGEFAGISWLVNRRE